MSFAFSHKTGPILIEADITGPVRSQSVVLMLDTGATTSTFSEEVLISLGYDLAAATDRVRMVTGSGVTTVPRVVLTRMTALGHSLFGLPVLAHSLPKGVAVNGLLGLDFLRDRVLTIDFKTGLIRLD